MNREEFEAYMNAKEEEATLVEKKTATLIQELDKRADALRSKLSEFLTNYIPANYLELVRKCSTKIFSTGVKIACNSGNYCFENSNPYSKIMFCIDEKTGLIDDLIPFIIRDMNIMRDYQEYAKYITACETLYEELVDTVPELYEYIAGISKKVLESETRKLEDTLEKSQVRIKEKKVTRVIIEIEE